MTPRQKAMLASSPSIALLLVTIGWNVLERLQVATHTRRVRDLLRI